MSNPENPKPTLETKLAQLDAATEWFYSDNFTLDQAITKYKSAIELSREIENDLKTLKNEMEVLADFTKE